MNRWKFSLYCLTDNQNACLIYITAYLFGNLRLHVNLLSCLTLGSSLLYTELCQSIPYRICIYVHTGSAFLSHVLATRSVRNIWYTKFSDFCSRPNKPVQWLWWQELFLVCSFNMFLLIANLALGWCSVQFKLTDT